MSPSVVCPQRHPDRAYVCQRRFGDLWWWLLQRGRGEYSCLVVRRLCWGRACCATGMTHPDNTNPPLTPPCCRYNSACCLHCGGGGGRAQNMRQKNTRTHMHTSPRWDTRAHLHMCTPHPHTPTPPHPHTPHPAPHTPTPHTPHHEHSKTRPSPIPIPVPIPSLARTSAHPHTSTATATATSIVSRALCLSLPLSLLPLPLFACAGRSSVFGFIVRVASPFDRFLFAGNLGTRHTVLSLVVHSVPRTRTTPSSRTSRTPRTPLLQATSTPLGEVRGTWPGGLSLGIVNVHASGPVAGGGGTFPSHAQLSTHTPLPSPSLPSPPSPFRLSFSYLVATHALPPAPSKQTPPPAPSGTPLCCRWASSSTALHCLCTCATHIHLLIVCRRLPGRRGPWPPVLHVRSNSCGPPLLVARPVSLSMRFTTPASPVFCVPCFLPAFQRLTHTRTTTRLHIPAAGSGSTPCTLLGALCGPMVCCTPYSFPLAPWLSRTSPSPLERICAV
jgi:hypothetical protein